LSAAAANGGTAVAGGKRERAWSAASQSPPPAPAAAGGVHGGRFEPPSYVIRQQAFDQPGYRGDAAAAPPPRSSGHRGGAGGCIMGLIAFSLICVLGVVLAGLAIGRPYLTDAVGDELGRALATEVVRELNAQAGAAGIAPGTYVIRSDEINAELAANAERFEPIENPRVQIDPDGMEITFEVYGLKGSYQGMVEAEQGQIVVTDIDASGTAAQIISAGDVREIVEVELNRYFANNNLEVERVELGDGTLTVEAVPAGSVPAATRTPAAADEDDTEDADDSEDAEDTDEAPPATRPPAPTPTPGLNRSPIRFPTPRPTAD
jgi:hypothetical protein